MTKDIIKDGENPRKKNVENANSEEVKGFQREDERWKKEIRALEEARETALGGSRKREDENRAIWENGHKTGIQNGVEYALLFIVDGLKKKFPDIVLPASLIMEQLCPHCGRRPSDNHNCPNENPDAGMEERERQIAEEMEVKG